MRGHVAISTQARRVDDLTIRRRAPRGEAFERLRNRARSRRARLDDVAAELVRAYDEAGRLTQHYAEAGTRKIDEQR